MSLAFTDQFCIADPLAAGESTTGMLAFPWIASTASGTLVMAYHDGVDGSAGATVTRIKTSTDLGVTWSPGRVVWDDGLDTGAQVIVLASGDWLLTSQGYTGNVPSGVYSRRSTDGGTTWQPAQFVTNSACSGGTYTSSAPIETAPGLLLWPVYGPEGGRDVSKVLASADGGVSWAVVGTLMALPGSVGAQEPVLQQLPDGTIVAMVRCTDGAARRTVSTDGGVTWSAPLIAFTGCGSRVDWIRLASGRCVASWRDATSLCALAAYSDDDMATVSTPVQYHGPDWRTSYSGLAEVRPGQVVAVVGEIDVGGTTGRIMRRYLLDGDAMAPTGQTTYVPSKDLAVFDGGPIAWDTFNRADNLQGLGSADSGHQWVDAGSSWTLVGGTAKVVGGAIHPVTLATGNKWGSIEASLCWSGGTSSPIGLIAKYNAATGHGLVAKLDASGTVVRFVDAAAQNTVLASTPNLSYLAGIWHRFRLCVKGDNAVLFINGQMVLSYRLTTADHAAMDAGTRWGLWGGSSGVTYQADNVAVWP